ncbi:MAG: Cytochrome bd-I ubiquinol oxidase subunit 2 [Chlamydiales bacterium]|nr:Cytochrome bd-I ubiquinol oxidase subunit 2 [Chlamydiales bacterium]MCH9635751.1 Cytochrome bd-I ubiquinol oxidase subunit 2 [Chlamydiales bacterium]
MDYGLAVFWYAIFMVAIACYAMLDGFDLGVGMLHLFARKDYDRRIFLNAIGPVWDGNEVWLIIVLGGLFAGFPLAYATLLSSFYIPVMVLITALIFRAVSIEFRSKMPMHWWRSMWDGFFAIGSLVIAFGVGCALGNFIQGIPLDEDQIYRGSIMLTFLRPYPVLVGLMAIALFVSHGNLYLVMKTEGELLERLKVWSKRTLILYIMFYVGVTMVTLIYQQHIVDRFRDQPLLFLIALANMLCIANIPRLVVKGNYGWAFLNSMANVGLLMMLFAFGMFPVLLRSSIDPAYSLTAMNSSASEKTLIVLGVIVAIGLPLVIAYMAWVYRIFKGKVVMDEHHSY